MFFILWLVLFGNRFLQFAQHFITFSNIESSSNSVFWLDWSFWSLIFCFKRSHPIKKIVIKNGNRTKPSATVQILQNFKQSTNWKKHKNWPFRCVLIRRSRKSISYHHEKEVKYNFTDIVDSMVKWLFIKQNNKNWNSWWLQYLSNDLNHEKNCQNKQYVEYSKMSREWKRYSHRKT